MKTSVLLSSVLLASTVAGAAVAGAPSEIRGVGWGVATDPLRGKAVIADGARGSLRIASLDTLEVSGHLFEGAAVRGVLVNTVSGTAYALLGAGFVVAIDLQTGRVLRKGAVGSGPTHMTAGFARGEIYVSNGGGASVSILHADTLKSLAEIPVAGEPGPATIDARRGVLYVVSAASGTVDVVDLDGRRPIARVTVGRNPGSAAVDEVSGKVYVNNVDDRTISVLHPATFAVTRTIATGAGSTTATVSAVHRRYYLPNADDNRVSVIDMVDDRIVALVAAGRQPHAAVLSSTEDEVIVIGRKDADATIIDASSADVRGKLAGGGRSSRAMVLHDRLLTISDPRTASDSDLLATIPMPASDTALATEYVDDERTHYLHTASEMEVRLFADGLYGEHWSRTMQFFRVWTRQGIDRVPVCQHSRYSGEAIDRVFSTPVECALLQADPAWTDEGTAYYVALPDAEGRCTPETEPLHRLYTRSASGVEAHRYVTHAGVRDTLIASGWVAEGLGDPAVFACVPKLARETPSIPEADDSARIGWPIVPMPRIR